MKNMRKFIKQNIKGFIVGLIVTGVGIVTASTIMPSNSVTYNNSSQNVTNVKEALDILIEKANQPKGATVTYVVNGVRHEEFVDYGNTCLKPSTFTPSISEATFLGWSKSASSTTVLTSLTMGESPITLYAVFKYADKTLTTATNGWETGYTAAATFTYDANKYYGLKFTNIKLRTGTTASGSSTSYLWAGSTKLATATSSSKVAFYNLDGRSYDLSSLSGTVTIKTTGDSWSSLICQSSSGGSIVTLGRTVVG